MIITAFALLLGLLLLAFLRGLVSGGPVKRARDKKVQYPVVIDLSPPPSVTWTLMLDFMQRAEAAHARRDYGEVLDISRKAMVWIPVLVKENAAERWGVGLTLRYPILDHLLRLAPVALDRASLEYVRRISANDAGLQPYRKEVEAAFEGEIHAAALYDAVRATPGIVQSVICKEWQGAASALYMADALGIVRRTKAGRSYSLEMAVDHSKRPLR